MLRCLIHTSSISYKSVEIVGRRFRSHVCHVNKSVSPAQLFCVTSQFAFCFLEVKNLVEPVIKTCNNKMAQRVTYRRRNPYNTRSNKIKVVKTPGGKLIAQHVKKNASRPKCGDCGSNLSGISTLRPRAYAQVSKTHKTVLRAYGGSRCASCVKDRIVRAFLIEEQKIVKRVLKEQEEKEKKAAKKSSKK